MKIGVSEDHETIKGRMPGFVRRHFPTKLKNILSRWYWRWVDFQDYASEIVGYFPSHSLRLFFYIRVLGVTIGQKTSIHRKCRFYRPIGVVIGTHTIINREVLLDGRTRLEIGNHVSISEGVQIFTLEHDPNSPSFEWRGGAVTVGDRAFLGARAMILPGITIGEGAVVAAGAVVTKAVEPYTIVGGVPARPIGQRRSDLSYVLTYQKFLG